MITSFEGSFLLHHTKNKGDIAATKAIADLTLNRVVNRTIWVDKKGIHQKKYQVGDFDYYAVYLPDIDKVVYPSVNFSGCYITTKVPNSATPFYWWEDFIDFTEDAPKRTYKEFGVDLTTRKVNLDSRIHTRKVERPSKAELQELVWEKPTTQIAKDFGVSDKAVEKWCKVYALIITNH
ncbi:hypothetical protein [Fischerella thermalis]|jgi:hypothetical protein|uniref:hypothetical protein n=1 Tax=Fischerella thermalis TaxID=372787 RepID=UPI0002D91C69|nr:hypothetical protein [Fischerella thermalis]PLZ06599.1 hypothetical protein CBP19_19620 [Fischerella thermalis WC1110]PLZ06720.1 hypothetical protein CBP18_17315 [Fischerella thermalis WC119]PLZ07501.1 hypothetical protein CBP17_16970 [Fischerella thermalis WC114]PLZ18202.1 hypothetical protein CBP30_17605 [Fischerella thermalis WC157]PLZ25526.1 hypothetical protein CBP29_08360 [Fischerella thermalis WC341]